MGPKLLFVLGIMLAHGAVAAGWLAQDAPRHRLAVVTTCARLPTQPLHIAPPRELLAYSVNPRAGHTGAMNASSPPEAWQP